MRKFCSGKKQDATGFNIFEQSYVSIAIALLVFISLLVFFKPAYSADYDYINISDPFLKKTPIAVPEFKTFTGHIEERSDGKKAKDMLIEALEFTGYLKSMNPVAFLANPSQSGIGRADINFRDWSSIKAELLITGGISEKNGKVRLELRLFDTFSGKRLVGNGYNGHRSNIREMVLRFCSDVSYALTGKRGVFDTSIAFVSTVNGKKEIFTCDFDGTNIKQVTSHKSISLSPSWSSDRKWLAYVTYSRGRPEIFIRNLSQKRSAVVNYKGLNISPDWMPGEQKLAASLSFSGDQEIYLLTIKGEIIKRITKSWGIDVSPKFSPDGEKIVFTSKRTGTPQIHIKDLKSQKVQRLTYKGMNNTSPVWSPDGSKIAYVGIEGNAINIFVMKINSGMPVQLTMNTGDNEDPSWAPDGSMISFTSTREGGVQRVFVMNASGTDQRRLLKIKGRQSQPDWSLSKNRGN